MTFEEKIDQIFSDNPSFNTQLAAKYLTFRPQTLCNMRHQRRGPVYHKIGGRIVYKKSDLDAYILAGRIDPSGSRN